MSQTHAIPIPSHALRIAMRVGAAVLGGYAFAWGVVAAGTSVLFAAGLGFHDAEFLGAMAGVLAYLVAFLWAIAAHRPTILGTATPFFVAFMAAQRAHGTEPLFPDLRGFVGGGAPITAELGHQLRELFPVSGVPTLSTPVARP